MRDTEEIHLPKLILMKSKYFFVGFISYLNQVHKIDMPPNFSWHCKIGSFILFTVTLCSTTFTLSMTFERFYSIIKPHKAASFNTVKKTKITIAIIVIFSTLYHIPHLFIKSDVGGQCLPYLGVLHRDYGKFYQLLSFTMNYVLPFVMLLVMNSVIIHYLRKRSKWTRNSLDHPSQGKEHKTKSLERNIYITLLLVSFMFIILTFPIVLLTISLMVFDYKKTSTRLAGYYLFYHIGQKTFYTNNGINFFLYVASGKKFTGDLLTLFSKKRNVENVNASKSTEMSEQNF